MQGTQGGCSLQRAWGPLSFLFTQTHSRDLYPPGCHIMGHPFPHPTPPIDILVLHGRVLKDDMRSVIPHPPHPRASCLQCLILIYLP